LEDDLTMTLPQVLKMVLHVQPLVPVRPRRLLHLGVIQGHYGQAARVPWDASRFLGSLPGIGGYPTNSYHH